MFDWLIAGSIVGFFVMLAVVVWWAWWQETASRYADGLDRRFAKYLTKPQLHRQPEPLKAYLDWVDWREMAGKWMELQENINPQVAQSFRELEQLMTALEEFERATTTMVERHERRLNRVAEELTEHLKAATPSPPTASPTTDSPSDAVQETTGVWTPQSWQLDPRITPGGPVGSGSEFAEPEDVLT